MAVWLDVTADRLIDLAPRRVLEIGCGAGLVLQKLAPHCQAYLGTDFSQQAIESLGRWVSRHPELSHVELQHREAADFEGLADDFDAIVLNSVVQYFPDGEYLASVLKQAAERLPSSGFIYVGDVRPLGLLPVFHTSVQLAKAPEDLSV